MVSQIDYTTFNVIEDNLDLRMLFPLYQELGEYDYSFLKDKAPMDQAVRDSLVMDAFRGLWKTVVATHNDKPVGFISISTDYGKDTISELFVLEPYRRLGIGRELVRRLKEFTPGKLKVNTIAGNEASLAFYESLGFVAVTISLTEIN